MATLRDARPQLVVMVANTAASAAFVKAFRAAGGGAQLATLSVTDGAQVVQEIGAATAHGLVISQVMPDPGNLQVPLVREISDLWRQAGHSGEAFNHTLIEGYLSAKVLVEGLRRAGPAPTPARLRDALEGLRRYDAGGVVIGFDATQHAGSQYTDITILSRSGKLLR